MTPKKKGIMNSRMGINDAQEGEVNIDGAILKTHR
jgi:hypothetical protein